jgi:uncharacterized RDD family membrane protein YckC
VPTDAPVGTFKKRERPEAAKGGAEDRAAESAANQYRTFWRRFWAGVIDALVLWPLLWVDEAIGARTGSAPLLVLWSVFYSLSGVAYTIVLHGRYGQTIGKVILGVKVLDVSGSRLSMKQAVLRDSVLLVLVLGGLVVDLPSIAAGRNPYADGVELTTVQLILLNATLAWFVVELVTMLSNARRRALHDFIAGSVVVRVASTKDNAV